MNREFVAVIAFGFAAVGGSMIRNGYQAGRMAPLLFNNLDTLSFRRDTAPAWFFGTLALNLVVVTLLALGGIAVLAAPHP